MRLSRRIDEIGVELGCTAEHGEGSLVVRPLLREESHHVVAERHLRLLFDSLDGQLPQLRPHVLLPSKRLAAGARLSPTQAKVELERRGKQTDGLPQMGECRLRIPLEQTPLGRSAIERWPSMCSSTR
jgi:hypothetical protein